jgi:hypothetical protein
MIAVKGQALTPDNWTQLLVPKELSKEEMNDLLGDVNRQRKFLDKVEGFLKEGILQHFPTDEWEFSTGRYQLTRTAGATVTVDLDKLKAEMGEEPYKEWFKNHSKRSEWFKITIKAIEK